MKLKPLVTRGLLIHAVQLMAQECVFVGAMHNVLVPPQNATQLFHHQYVLHVTKHSVINPCPIVFLLEWLDLVHANVGIRQLVAQLIKRAIDARKMMTLEFACAEVMHFVQREVQLNPV